jgi:hypothetical protein
MSTLTLNLPTAATPASSEPRATFGRRILTVLVAMGQARASAELRRQAALCADSRPELARRMLEAANRGPEA